MRGSRQESRVQRIAVLNLEVLEKKFNAGEIVSPKILLEKGIIGKIKGRTTEVKILGKGKINKKLIVENCEVSKSAKEKIEKSGGAIK